MRTHNHHKTAGAGVRFNASSGKDGFACAFGTMFFACVRRTYQYQSEREACTWLLHKPQCAPKHMAILACLFLSIFFILFMYSAVGCVSDGLMCITSDKICFQSALV